MILTYKNGNSQFVHGDVDVCEVVIDDLTIGCYHNGERVTISSRDAWEHCEQDPNLGKHAEHGYSSIAQEYHDQFCYHKWIAEYQMEQAITPVSNI